MGTSEPVYLAALQSTCTLSLQVLRYFDYVFTGVFTFEMVIKVRAPQAGCDGGAASGKQLRFSILLLNFDDGDFKAWFLVQGVQSAQCCF